MPYQMQNKISILHLEDQPADSILVKSFISKGISSFDYFFVDDEATFVSTLKEKKIDIILSDYQLPDYLGSEALLFVKNQYPHIPFIFVTGKMGEDAAIESLLNGATDYVFKSKLERLIPAIKRVLYEGELLQNRLASDKALRESEEKYRSVTQSANDAIITANSKGIILGWNRGAENIFGYTEEEITGKELSLIMPQSYGKNHHKNIERIVNGGDRHVIGKTVELTGLHKRGYEFAIELSLAEWDTASGKFFTGTIRDITRRKQDDAALLKAKEKAETSDRLKTAFIRNISHEIRTPLNGILGFGQLMADPDLSSDQKEEFLFMVNASSDRLIKTVANIMDISYIVSGNQEVKKKNILIGSLLDEVYSKFSQPCALKKLNLSFQKQPFADELQINSDPDFLSKILNHLVDNAIKFTREGSIVVGCSIMENEIVIFVKDSGIGINLNVETNIFDHFFQEDISISRDHEGSGLGLSIAKGLVELLGGRIWVESVKGEGSTFFFTIPIEVTEAEITNQLKATREVHGKPLILIADDEETNRLLLEQILNKLGLDVVVVTDGQQALEACYQNHLISLVLMDLKMPVMDGFEATKKIKVFRPDLPVIALTAFALSGDEERALAAGCDDYLTKPLKRNLLIGKLTQYGVVATPP